MFLFQSPQHLSTEHTNPWGEDFEGVRGRKKKPLGSVEASKRLLIWIEIVCFAKSHYLRNSD